MDIEISLPEKNDKEDKRDKLNTWVAITVALLASFMGICKIKDDNIVQAMQMAQADKIDHWAWYQSLHTREDMMANELERLALMQTSAPQESVDAFKKQMAATQEKLDKIIAHKEEMKKNAEEDQKNYDALNFRDDQFDLGDAMVAIAISLLALTSLVQKRWLYGLALLPSLGGFVMGMAGLCGLPLHPDFVIRLLS